MSNLKLRIQVGRHKGRVISVSGGEVRPSMGWLREVIFNWLFDQIRGMNVLDACTGTGILAFEASSLGASSVTCLDMDRQQLESISKQAAFLSLPIKTRVHTWPQSWKAPEPYHLIFWDPPYHMPWRHDVFSLIEEGGWLTVGGVLCIESHSDDVYAHPQWQLLKTKKRGGSQVQLWKRQTSA